MLFLLNDTVIDLGPNLDVSPAIAARVSGLSPAEVVDLVREAFSKSPGLAARSPAAARKAALMLVIKAPSINAAMVVPMAPGCPLSEVSTRFASVDEPVLNELKAYQDNGALNAGIVNLHVWER